MNGDRPPTDKTLSVFWASLPDGDYTCSFCGAVGPKAYVQPQHPYWARRYNVPEDGAATCTDCHNQHYREGRERRKIKLAAEPRCEFCQRRGTVHYGLKGATSTPALLCGHHGAVAKRRLAENIGGMFWLMSEMAGDDVRAVLR